MKRVLRWFAFLLVTLIAVAAVGALITVVASNRMVDERVAVVPPAPVLGHGSVERGKHLYAAVSDCIMCHGSDGGGGPFITDSAMAVLNAPNLTRGPGGVGTLYSDADYDRAIRRGIRPDGTRLIIMPSWGYAALSDSDAASIVAYIRTLAPVDRAAPRVRLGPVGRVLMVTHRLPLDATRIVDEGPPPPPPPPMMVVEYGKYLARIGACMTCHGTHLSGGHLAGPPDVPPASNLTPTGIGTWSAATFMITLTKGRDPSGH
ncbi:MAG TPA: c-type cytochrome, partial [Xanthomonadales bacterium]|nr:c-type cytochrome [Xanthomonadales bacterium]